MCVCGVVSFPIRFESDIELLHCNAPFDQVFAALPVFWHDARDDDDDGDGDGGTGCGDDGVVRDSILLDTILLAHTSDAGKRRKWVSTIASTAKVRALSGGLGGGQKRVTQ